MNKLVNLNLFKVDAVKLGAQPDSAVRILKNAEGKEEITVSKLGTIIEIAKNKVLSAMNKKDETVEKSDGATESVEKTGETTFEDNLQIINQPWEAVEAADIAWYDIYVLTYALDASVKDILLSDVQDKQSLINAAIESFKNKAIEMSANWVNNMNWVNKSVDADIMFSIQEAINKSIAKLPERNAEIAKSVDEIEKALTPVMKENAELKAEVERLNDEKITNEFIAKAREFSNINVTAEELGLVLKSAHKNMPNEFEKLLSVLKSTDNVSKASSSIFEEIGKSTIVTAQVLKSEADKKEYVYRVCLEKSKSSGRSFEEVYTEYTASTEYGKLRVEGE